MTVKSLKFLPYSVAAILVLCALLCSCSPILVGKYTVANWKTESQWAQMMDEQYAPPPEKIQRLTTLIDSSVTFTLVAGSWCPASRLEVPRLYKLFAILRIPAEIIPLYGTNIPKQEPKEICARYDIQAVPTLLVLRNSVVAGRIEEHPSVSWEDDIATILERTRR
jgi:thiol-disulfide isomerase/thioredoxin